MPSNSLAKNTVMLYILTASNYILGLITVPYLTRVLGPETYGVVGFGQATSVYIQLVLDFGFLLSATAEVANHSDSSAAVSRIMSSVMCGKISLLLICGVAVMAICFAVPEFGNESTLIGLFFLFAAANSFIPDYVYRGLEMMSAITYRTVAVKALFVVCVFIFVRSEADYLLVPIFYFLGSIVAIVVAYFHLAKTKNVHFVLPRRTDVIATLKSSSAFFASRIASTFYSTMNYMVIGLIYPGSVELGCYTATDKAITAGKSASSPIADSLYPYMLRTKNFTLLIKISIIGFLCLTIICIGIFIFAEPITLLLFGESYAGAAPMLQILIPIVALSLISYLYGFPALAPMGKASFANLSVVIGAVIQSALLVVLVISGELTVYSVCICTLITESFVTLSRVIVFFNTYAKLRKGNLSNSE